MVVPQAAILVGGLGLFGIFLAFAAYYAWEEERHQRHRYRQDPSPLQLPAPRPVLLGPCGICGGDVFYESYLLPCNHHLHGTCAADIAISSLGHGTLNWADICRNCVIPRDENDASTRAPENEGLRNRGTNREICADCREAFLDDDETKELACNRHQVHKKCWNEIAASGFTTCALCMEEV